MVNYFLKPAKIKLKGEDINGKNMLTTHAQTIKIIISNHHCWGRGGGGVAMLESKCSFAILSPTRKKNFRDECSVNTLSHVKFVKPARLAKTIYETSQLNETVVIIGTESHSKQL